MALNFPSNPVDGQVYPDPAVPGATQYIYNSSKGTWLTVFKGVERVSAQSPIYTFGSQTNPTVAIYAATDSRDGYMSAADKAKLNAFPPTPGSVTQVTAGEGIGAPNTGDSITTTGTLKVVPATTFSLGGVKIGNGVAMTPDGVLNLSPPAGSNLGGVKAGPGVTIATDGTISTTGGSGSYAALDSISGSFNGVLSSFPMRVNGVPYSPASINALLIFVGGIIQTPLVNFTINGSQIIFSDPPPSGATFYGISLA